MCNKAHVLCLIAVLVLTGCVPGSQSSQPKNQSTLSGGGGSSSGGSGANETGTNGETGNIAGTPDTPGGDGGSYNPTSALFCGETGQIVLQKNQQAHLSWSYPNGFVPPSALNFTLESVPGGIAQIGSVSPESSLSAWYHAPAAVASEFLVNVRATFQDQTTPSVCTIRLVPDGAIGIPDDGTTRGAVGNVYPLPVNQPNLPDFAMMTPVSSVLVPNFDVPQRSFSDGFPGVPDLFEWFGIRFDGRIVLPTSGTYQFRVNSDDGSKFWMDGQLVINNDGVHAPRAVDATITKNAGTYSMRMDYYQGPRYLIALQLFWIRPGQSQWEIVPPDNFLRPSP